MLVDAHCVLARAPTLWLFAGVWYNGNTPPPEDSACIADPVTCRQDTWRAMEAIFASGKARAIGVANFEQRHIEDILALKVGDGGEGCTRTPSLPYVCTVL